MDNEYYKGTQKTVVLALQVLMELVHWPRGDNTATPAWKGGALTWTGWKNKAVGKSLYWRRTLFITLIPSWAIGYVCLVKNKMTILILHCHV